MMTTPANFQLIHVFNSESRSYKPFVNAVEMDMPVNVPVDDPDADTEWYANQILSPATAHKLGRITERAQE